MWIKTKEKVSGQSKNTTKGNSNELYQRKKELDKDLRKHKKTLEASESKIEQLEKELGGLQALMNNPERITDNTLFQMHGKLEKQLEEEMENWEKITHLYETSSQEKEELLKKTQP